ncbi:hypothetical protein ACTFIT_006708 [Dictyostelium discoideum]
MVFDDCSENLLEDIAVTGVKFKIINSNFKKKKITQLVLYLLRTSSRKGSLYQYRDYANKLIENCGPQLMFSSPISTPRAIHIPCIGRDFTFLMRFLININCLNIKYFILDDELVLYFYFSTTSSRKDHHPVPAPKTTQCRLNQIHK